MSRIHYSHCPVCGSSDTRNVLMARDHTVSGEQFSIAECSNCSLRFTQDIPDAVSIIPYYKSEDYISHSDTAKGLINRLYHSVRKRTLAQKGRLVIKATGRETGRLLDMGSGTGAFLNEMKGRGWEITGLEPDEDARKVARQLHGIELSEASLLYRLPAAGFDAITLWHVLEHVHELNPAIQQLKTILKDTGRLMIAVPNYTSADAKIYAGSWAAYDVPRHLYHFSPRSMEVLMNRNGLKILDYKPMWFDSFYISMLSSRYKNGKTNLFTACLNGLRSNIQAAGNVKKCSSVIYIIGK